MVDTAAVEEEALQVLHTVVRLPLVLAPATVDLQVVVVEDYLDMVEDRAEEVAVTVAVGEVARRQVLHTVVRLPPAPAPATVDLRVAVVEDYRDMVEVRAEEEVVVVFLVTEVEEAEVAATVEVEAEADRRHTEVVVEVGVDRVVPKFLRRVANKCRHKWPCR